MNKEQRDLLYKLATQAGMRMEHTSAHLILLGDKRDDELAATLNAAQSDLKQAIAMIEAAKCLVDNS